MLGSTLVLTATGCASGHASNAPQPPRPRLTSRGVQRHASLVTYCWAVRQSNGSSNGTCAAGRPLPTRQKLSWQPQSPITLDLTLAAKDVQVQLANKATRPRHPTTIDLRRLDATGRRWTFSLTRADRSARVLFVSAQFAQGDIYAELSLTNS